MAQDHRYKELQLAQLRGFCLAAREGSFTAAAKALGLSASTVWQQVRALEREFKVRLVLRRGRAIELTEHGARLLEIVQPHVTGIDSLRRLFETRRDSNRQELVIASGAYLFANHLPRPIHEFREARPDVQVTLRIAAWAALKRLTEYGEIDIGVLACDPDVPRSPALEYEHLFDEPFSALLPAGHRLLRAKRIAPPELVKYPLILPPKGGADRKAFDRWLRKHDMLERVRPALVCGQIDVVKKYVAMGTGIALMYMTDEVTANAPGLHRRPVDSDIGALSIEMAIRKGTHLPDHVEDFRQRVRQHLADHS